MSYTKEPWAINGLRIESKYEHGWANDGWIISDCAGPDGQENARRIVACVNACAGIPTEELERTKSVGIIKTVRAKVAAEKQRDDLLAALEKCAMFKLQPGTIQQIVNKAIASVKGGAA